MRDKRSCRNNFNPWSASEGWTLASELSLSVRFSTLRQFSNELYLRCGGSARLLRYPVDIIRGVVARSSGAGSCTPCVRAAPRSRRVVPRLGDHRERKRESECKREGERGRKRKKNFGTSRRVGRTGVISTSRQPRAVGARCLLARTVFACVPVYVIHTYVHDTCIPCRREKGSRLNCWALLTAPGNLSRWSPESSPDAFQFYRQDQKHF